MALTLTHLPKTPVIIGSIALTLAIGKGFHALTSMAQAAKDRNRLAVMTAKQSAR